MADELVSPEGESKPQMNAQSKGCLVVIVLIVAVAIWAGISASNKQPFTGVVAQWAPIDEANIRVVLELTNDGDAPAKGECTVRAYDASRVVGFDILSSPDEIPPGESRSYNGAIRIEDLGAFRVADVTAEDCGQV